jgi:hypothetical protein
LHDLVRVIALRLKTMFPFCESAMSEFPKIIKLKFNFLHNNFLACVPTHVSNGRSSHTAPLEVDKYAVTGDDALEHAPETRHIPAETRGFSPPPRPLMERHRARQVPCQSKPRARLCRRVSSRTIALGRLPSGGITSSACNCTIGDGVPTWRGGKNPRICSLSGARAQVQSA